MEKIETINEYLRTNFGIDTVTVQPMWRVVWADDQYEMQLCRYSEGGVELLTPEVRNVRKYSWIKHFYILEFLEVVPDTAIKELAGSKIAYSCKWVFQDALEQPLPPSINACKFVIDVYYAAIGKSQLQRISEMNAATPANPITSDDDFYQSRKKEIDDLENELFGDESGLKGTTINSGSAIIVPPNYKKEN